MRCLEAITQQNIPKSYFHVIVVSDGPDEITEKALLDWKANQDLKLTYVHTALKLGPAAARNYGWRLAQTQLIAFTDDDCIPGPSWLKAYLKRYSGEDLIAFSGRTIVPPPAVLTDFAINLAHLEDADFITANCACTKLALNKVGGFDERYTMAWREDSDLEFKFITHRIVISKVPDAEVVHPVRKVPWGISLQEQKKGYFDALLFKKFPDLYRRKIVAPIWNYYGIIVLSILLLIAIYLHFVYLYIICAAGLCYFFSLLIVKRLENRHKSFSHVTEMITTSLLIPFLSVFWRVYGAVKYRVFFL
jgi:glycosyltransferase involved in cell wall biosynthesis